MGLNKFPLEVQRCIFALNELHRYENQIGITDIFEVVSHALTFPKCQVLRIFRLIPDMPGYSFRGTRTRSAWGQHGPEVIQDVPVKGQPFTRFQLNDPDSCYRRFQQQSCSNATIGVGFFAFLDQFWCPSLKVPGRHFAMAFSCFHEFTSSEIEFVCRAATADYTVGAVPIGFIARQ